MQNRGWVKVVVWTVLITMLLSSILMGVSFVGL
ncbi:MAG TPA: stressosome-associated protein Prli42 [Paenibacillus sp.]|nr:stressosome-associated protein Prli42 [Paenibacillus sp.]